MILSYGLFNPMTFGGWLKKKRGELRISGAELERLSGVSRQYISNLERELTYEKTQNPVRPSVEVVDKIARALNVDADEARLAAGYAPRSPSGDIPITADLRVRLLNKNLTEEEREEIAQELGFAYEVLMRRIENRRKETKP